MAALHILDCFSVNRLSLGSALRGTEFLALQGTIMCLLEHVVPDMPRNGQKSASKGAGRCGRPRRL